MFRATLKFVRNEEGLETVEYAVMTALITGAVILAFIGLGQAMSDRFDATSTVISTAGTP